MLPETLRLNGTDCRLTVRRTARKNMIVRLPQPDRVQLSVPPQWGDGAIRAWLDDHRQTLARLQARAAQTPLPPVLPARVWYLGRPYAVMGDRGLAHPDFDGHAFRLPVADAAQQKQQLIDFLYHRAHETLLPRLHTLAARTGLLPEKTRLTRAQTFWGVCRARRIALNWRLIGAPSDVMDYVCLHELCHLREAHHGQAFWALLGRHCTDAGTARQWLKSHHGLLFSLG